jgi:acetoin utilization deacetylase AcuC-like enzyme
MDGKDHVEQRPLKRANEELMDEEAVRESFNHLHHGVIGDGKLNDDDDPDSEENQPQQRIAPTPTTNYQNGEGSYDQDDGDYEDNTGPSPFANQIDEEEEDNDDASEEEDDDDEIIPTQLAVERAVTWYLSVAQPQVSFRTGLAYDVRMMNHKHPYSHHPECPERVESIMLSLETVGFSERMRRLPITLADESDLLLVHSQRHLAYVKSLLNDSTRKEQFFSLEHRSAFASDGSVEAAYVSAGCVITALENIANSTIKNAMCVVRPPGHHAERDQVCGFCLFDNVAVAAAVATTRLGFQRVLVLDWDIHHGNGIQHAFEDTSKVLYVSLHRWDSGRFYPGGPDGSPTKVGVGAGTGYNINIAWNNSRGGFNDSDYLAAFDSVVMPAARAYNPDLVLVSAGFDAAIGDPLGGCSVSPYGYGEMLHRLSSLANGRVIVALEGGYCLPSISASMVCCAAVLLGDGIPSTQKHPVPASTDALRSIVATLEIHAKLDNPFSRAWTSSYIQTLAARKYFEDQAMEADSEDEIPDDAELQDHQYRPSASKDMPQSPPPDTVTDDGKISYKEQTMLIVEPDVDNDETSHPYISANIQAPPSKADGRPLPDALCETCGNGDVSVESEKDNWVCLRCYSVFCCSEGKRGHARIHAETTGHCIAMSLSSLMMWDFRMNSYVTEPHLNSDLRPILEVFHEDKFGNSLPPISSSLVQ